MLLIKSAISRDLSGYVTLRPQEDEDIWHAYNLIQQGDQLRGSAIR
jgi:protein pelota